ncbi:hypothetical protein P879_09737 [Paragonimus westermani]|uniref:PID domain-containing protein n=1 Tax=Paragonimus westermani TaxID=34504 RepID=A0A8T0D2N2_9TREM|nr:hypothetical protein P879_09737 [Paragonimus westermani]
MSLGAPSYASQFDRRDAASVIRSFLPSHFGAFAGNQAVIKAAEYIGSFIVTGKGHHDRAEIVRQKLEAARAYTHSKPIILLISLNGIKVCRDSDEHVYMAHALRRISYATCDPDHLQFAFLAREPKAEPNVQYCHAFVTTTAEEAEELNNIVGEAFRIAYAQQQLAALNNQFRQGAAVLVNPTPTSPSRRNPCVTSEDHPANCVDRIPSVVITNSHSGGDGKLSNGLESQPSTDNLLPPHSSTFLWLNSPRSRIAAAPRYFSSADHSHSCTSDTWSGSTDDHHNS